MPEETRRQHFLPRFLLKGFASRNRRDHFYAYCFRLGHPPYETNIINLGVGMDFYGRGSQSNVEAGLSVIENEHAEIVERIRRDGFVGDARGVSCQCRHRERSYQARIGTGARLLAAGQAARLATEVLNGR